MYEDVFDYILEKIESNIESLRGKFPHVSKNGVWETKKNTSDDFWTLGFWPGMLWLVYMETNNRKYEKLAYEWMRLIEHRKNERDHDLGFVFFPSFVKGYELTEDTHLRNVALTAADSLFSLYNPKSNFIHTRPRERGITAIDTMMNLPLLWWAYEKTCDPRYYDAACTHAITTMQHFVRDDGSTYHIVEFDPESGQIIRKTTWQGYSDTSCWSRGQSWAIYGFTVAYKKTKYSEFIITAERVADYFISHLPDDYVPYWDFDDPEIPNAVKDSSAAAIACSGLLTLSELSKKDEFKTAALKILSSLSRYYLAEDADGILKHGCFHKPKGIGVDERLIWGDYYFVEALCNG